MLFRRYMYSVFLGIQTSSHAMLSLHLLTIGGESQLSADHRGILIVPLVITHCPIPPSNTHLHPAPNKSILVIVQVLIVLRVLSHVVITSIISHHQPETALLT